MPGLRDMALEAFEYDLPEFYNQCSPLIDPLIIFVLRNIYLDLQDDDLPRWSCFETSQERELRSKIINYLMTEICQQGCTFFDDDVDEHIFTVVLYWYLKDPSAEFIRERMKTRDRATRNTRPLKFFQQYPKRTFKACAHALERTLAYCHPNPPVLMRWEPFYNPKSFYGERNASVPVMKRYSYGLTLVIF